jgi:hypothetical protein
MGYFPAKSAVSQPTCKVRDTNGRRILAKSVSDEWSPEDRLSEVDHIVWRPIRKKNSKRALPPYVEFVQHAQRKMVETVGSLRERMLPKSIHAVTAEGFEPTFKGLG